jgi:beta-glucanase (GH16 family)
MRFLARIIGSPGACAGMFTYLAPNSSTSPVQEADIEILTSGPRNLVQYTNQPSNLPSGEPIPAATSNASLPFKLDWSTWNAYRLDWTPGKSTWYVNGEKVAEISFQTPRDPAALLVNMWGDGGPWTGEMAVHDAAFLQVQYIEIAYNTSGTAVTAPAQRTTSKGGASTATGVAELGDRSEKADGRGGSDHMGALRRLERRAGDGTTGCKVVCAVDEGVYDSNVGTPALLYNSTSPATSNLQRSDFNFWALGLLVGIFFTFGFAL